MRRLRALRVRFALWTAGLCLVVLSAFGAYVYGSMARGLLEAIDDSLMLSASQVTAAIGGDGSAQDWSDRYARDSENDDYAVRILSPQGQILWAFGSHQGLPRPPADPPAVPTYATWIEATSQDPLRVYTVRVEEGGRPVAIVQVAQSLEDMQETLRRLLTTLLIGLPLLVAAAGFGGYLLAARALAPIDHITRTARRISAEDLSARLNLAPVDDEVGRLAETLDAMLARLDDSFRRERQFTADASHELRTPLAAMHAILGYVRAKRRPPEAYEQAFTDLAHEVSRLRRLTENLLQLARGEELRRSAREPLDLSILLQDVVDSMQPRASAKGLALSCDLPGTLALHGDRDDLIRLFANLVDNAIKYTDHGTVTITAQQTRDAEITVTVADTGVGIPPEHLPYVFERFYRVDRSRTSEGAGLGLSIALDIARAHGGRIDLWSTNAGGTRFTVNLPTNSG